MEPNGLLLPETRLVCTDQNRSRLRTLSGFFIHRSCECAVKPFPLTDCQRLGDPSRPPTCWAGRSPGRGMGPFWSQTPGSAGFAAHQVPHTTPADAAGRPAVPAGSGRACPDSSSSTYRASVSPDDEVPGYNHRHLTGLPREVSGALAGPGVVVGKTTSPIPAGAFPLPALAAVRGCTRFPVADRSDTSHMRTPSRARNALKPSHALPTHLNRCHSGPPGAWTGSRPPGPGPPH